MDKYLNRTGNEEQGDENLKFLRNLKRKGKAYEKFEESYEVLKQQATSHGLGKKKIKLLLDIIRTIPLGSNKLVSLVKCMIPREKLEDSTLESLLLWCTSNFSSSPANLSVILVQWLIGVWEFQLCNTDLIYNFYDVLFYALLKHRNLEVLLSHLIYIATKPEDVTRRQVIRLLKIIESRRRQPKHIIAILSLFKSYKPEVVPEKIAAINVQSVWRPLPDALVDSFVYARERVALNEDNEEQQKINWAIVPASRNKKKKIDSIIPSVGYFNMGSSIFFSGDFKSIFDITNVKDLGKFHSLIKLPSRATSLLANSIGYHLLLFSEPEYQCRFMHNLYNMLWISFIFENGKYPKDEMIRLLDLTIEFSKYMQRGVPMVNYFINEFLNLGVLDEYYEKIVDLIQWSISNSLELKQALNHLKKLFYTSSVGQKRDLIRLLKSIRLNICVIKQKEYQDKKFPFLEQKATDEDIVELFEIIGSFSEQLITSALNSHSNNFSLLFECLLYYEELHVIEKREGFLCYTVLPPSVVYGCFNSRNAFLISEMCGLLLNYVQKLYDNEKCIVSENVILLRHYIVDILDILWEDAFISNRLDENRYLLKDISQEIIEGIPYYNFNSVLNITNNLAFLPYKYVVTQKMKNVDPANINKETALLLAEEYYPNVYKLIQKYKYNTLNHVLRAGNVQTENSTT